MILTCLVLVGTMRRQAGSLTIWMRPECSAFKRNREGAKGAHHARSETYRFPLSAFRSPLLPGLSLTCRVSIRECSALFILHSALPLRVVRAPGGAHRGWDPGRVFSVRAPGFAHQEQVQSGGIYQRSAITRQPEGRIPQWREEREGEDSCFGRRLPISDFRFGPAPQAVRS
jgi:hypothetical protein